MKKLTKSDVEKIARLARLLLTDSEIETFTPQLSEVLDYFSRLQEVNTDHVKPSFHTLDGENRFQENKLESDTLPPDEVTRNAKEKKDHYILTKQVIK